MAQTSDWSPKLKESHFTADRLDEAIDSLEGLKLLWFSMMAEGGGRPGYDGNRQPPISS
jgi:hypothetical protein